MYAALSGLDSSYCGTLLVATGAELRCVTYDAASATCVKGVAEKNESSEANNKRFIVAFGKSRDEFLPKCERYPELAAVSEKPCLGVLMWIPCQHDFGADAVQAHGDRSCER